MSAQHTPGPWEADIARDGATASVRCADGTVVFHLPSGLGGASSRTADASIGAAAPELLSNLRALVAKYGDFGPGQPFELPADHPIVAARAAIAKAEGRS